MLTFITGGAASGKSAYAEALAASADADRLFYVATMKPDGAEAQERIERHKAERSGKNFITVECPKDLKELKIPAEPERSLILLEDLGNLVANEQFDGGGSDEEITERVIKGLKALCRQAGMVIVVGDDVFSDTGDYEKETLRYMRLLAECDESAANLADTVTEVIYGIAVPVK